MCGGVAACARNYLFRYRVEECITHTDTDAVASKLSEVRRPSRLAVLCLLGSGSAASCDRAACINTYHTNPPATSTCARDRTVSMNGKFLGVCAHPNLPLPSGSLRQVTTLSYGESYAHAFFFSVQTLSTVGYVLCASTVSIISSDSVGTMRRVSWRGARVFSAAQPLNKCRVRWNHATRAA